MRLAVVIEPDERTAVLAGFVEHHHLAAQLGYLIAQLLQWISRHAVTHQMQIALIPTALKACAEPRLGFTRP